MPNSNGPPGPAPLYDLDSERAALGSLLMDREAVIAVAPWLRPEHFYLEKHGRIYGAVLACYGRREPPDIATVAAQLRATGELELVGGYSALAELSQSVPTALHVEYYGRIVEAYAARRALLEASGHVAAAALDAGEATVEERVGRAAEAVAAVAAGRAVDEGFVSAAAATSEYLAAVMAADDDDAEGGLLGISTGYIDLNRITKGMKPGEFIVLAARPGEGKTSLALCIAEHVARRGNGVGFFSMEMDRELLINRLVASRLGVDSTTVPRLVRAGDVRAMEALGELSELPLHIDHTAGLNPISIRARAARLAAEHTIDLWIVDYIQLATSDNARDDEYQRVTAVSKALTGLARTTRTPVLALSQMSRAVEQRGSHVPQLSDLRGSGAIEQDASQVWFIYRDREAAEAAEAEGRLPTTEIHVAKHRNGETGICPLIFDRASTTFRNLERYREPIGFESWRESNAAD